MKLPEYTISPELSASIEAAFQPLLNEKIDGVPLVDWLSRKDDEVERFIPQDIAERLSTTLKNAFIQQGGSEGLQLLETMGHLY